MAERTRIDQYTPEAHAEMPAGFPPGGVMWIIGETVPHRVVFRCPCGCEDPISLPMGMKGPPAWNLHVGDEGRPSITPSINRVGGGSECKSHFFITNGKTVWA